MDIAKKERIAIMIHDGGCTEQGAEAYCRGRPDLYGVAEEEESQDKLF